MNLEQKLEAVQNQLNEIKSELEANKRKREELKKRNWPEKLKPGMLFTKWGVYYIVARIERSMGLRLIGLQDGNRYSDDSLFGSSKKEFAYIGLAKDRIKIEDAPHEPTGADLVGKRVEVTNDLSDPVWATSFPGNPICVTDYQPTPDYTGEGSAWVPPVVARETKDPWESSKLDYDRSIHSNRDAKAWADFFVATYPGLADKHDILLGWFANAMMAMHDSLKQEASAVVVPEITDERLREMIVNAARRCGSIDFDPEGVSGGDLEILREIRDDLANLFRAIPADRVLGEGEARIGGDELQMLRCFAGRRMSEREYDRLEAVHDVHEEALRANQGGAAT